MLPQASLHYTVTGRGPYELFDGAGRVATLARPDDVLYVLYGRCHRRLLDHLTSNAWVPVHGGVVGVGGRRVLVVGTKRAGKTTLMLRLLFDGQQVEGDELVFMRGSEAVCLPRNFHVKPGTRDLVPELEPGWDALPATSTSDGTVITAFNPTEAGFDWMLLQGPIDTAFVLRPQHRGAAVVRPLTSVELVEAAVSNSFGVSLEGRAVVRACARLLGGVEGFELTVGRVSDTADLLIGSVT
ncbi:MAG: hypothetical protein M3163_08355 [Actinomycetota bacterium]|nr:hypothetical protein [Actinomycetota bacterium]